MFNNKSVPLIVATCLASVAFSPMVNASSPVSVKAPSTGASKLKVSIDLGSLAKTSHSKVIPKVANTFDDIPFMNGEPEHVEVTFDNDKTDSFAWQRKVTVYPIAAYAKLFKGKERIAFDKTIASLKSIIAKGNADDIKTMPMLPAIDSYEEFHNHAHVLNCKNGKGVAFVACYGQDEGPLSNGDFFYTYQGISSDGQYYVAVTYPVSASKLKKDTPPKEGKALISHLKEGDFNPNLNDIDRMIESITF